MRFARSRIALPVNSDPLPEVIDSGDSANGHHPPQLFCNLPGVVRPCGPTFPPQHHCQSSTLRLSRFRVLGHADHNLYVAAATDKYRNVKKLLITSASNYMTLSTETAIYRDTFFGRGPAASYFNRYLFRLFGIQLNVLNWASSLLVTLFLCLYDIGAGGMELPSLLFSKPQRELQLTSAIATPIHFQWSEPCASR